MLRTAGLVPVAQEFERAFWNGRFGSEAYPAASPAPMTAIAFG